MSITHEEVSIACRVALFILLLMGMIKKHGQNDEDAIYIFSLIFFIYALLSPLIPESMGYLYHLIDATLSVVIINLLSLLRPSGLIVHLQNISYRLIYINLLGWVAYELYTSPIYYNFACLLFYLLALHYSAKRGGYARDIAIHFNGIRFYSVNRSGLS